MNRLCAATLALLLPVSLVLHQPSCVSAQPAAPRAVTLWHQPVAAIAGQQPLTVRQLYHQVETQLAQSGKIYMALIRRTIQGGGIGRSDITQVWVDARHD